MVLRGGLVPRLGEFCFGAENSRGEGLLTSWDFRRRKMLLETHAILIRRALDMLR